MKSETLNAGSIIQRKIELNKKALSLVGKFFLEVPTVTINLIDRQPVFGEITPTLRKVEKLVILVLKEKLTRKIAKLEKALTKLNDKNVLTTMQSIKVVIQEDNFQAMTPIHSDLDEDDDLPILIPKFKK